jgi:hypothetical protein
LVSEKLTSRRIPNAHGPSKKNATSRRRSVASFDLSSIRGNEVCQICGIRVPLEAVAVPVNTGIFRKRNVTS